MVKKSMVELLSVTSAPRRFNLVRQNIIYGHPMQKPTIIQAPFPKSNIVFLNRGGRKVRREFRYHKSNSFSALSAVKGHGFFVGLAFAHLLILCSLLFPIPVSAQPEDLQQLTAKFDTLLSQQFKSHEPGATALVARNGQVIYKKAFGMANLESDLPMQVDNVFWVASIGKQFTAVAILQLMEQGKLNLQDEITKFIPDYPTQGNKISIEHLLTHSSGIHNFSGMKDPEKKLALDCTPNEVIDFFKNLPMRFTPGTKWEYSNSGYFLLGYIIEQITGRPYSVYLEDNFFKPLGMTNSFYANDIRIIKNRVGAYSQGENGFLNSKPRNITHVYSAGAIQSTV